MAFVREEEGEYEETAGRWVPVASFTAVYEADFARATLESAGIPAHLQGDHIAIFGPGWAGPTARGITVLVPAECLSEARDLLGVDEEGGSG